MTCIPIKRLNSKVILKIGADYADKVRMFQRIKHLYDSLPTQLRLIFSALLLLPWSQLYVHASVLSLTALIAIPCLMIFCLQRRNFWFLPLYFVESGLLSYMLYATPTGLSENLRLGLGLCFMLFSLSYLSFFSLETFYPFLTIGERAWRQGSRTPLYRLCFIEVGGSSYPAILRNLSQHGIGLSIGMEAADVRTKLPNKSTKIVLVFGSERFSIEAAIRWQSALGQEVELGLATEQREVTAQMIALCSRYGLVHNSSWVLKVLAKPEFRRVMGIVMCLSMLGIVAIPACGDNIESFIAQDDSQELTIETSLGPPQGLELAGTINDYELEVFGCKSGFNKKVTLLDGLSSINVSRGDSACLVKINWIRYNNVIFTVPTGSSFDTALMATTEFVSAASDQVWVTNFSVLPSPITNNVSLYFRFTDTLLDGTSSLLGPAISEVKVLATAALVKEGPGALATLRFSRTLFLNRDLAVSFVLSGTAVAGADYTAPTSMQVVFPSGASTIDLNIGIINDSVLKSDRTLTLSLSPGVGYFTGNQTTSVIIVDDDATVTSTGILNLIASPATLTLTNTLNVSRWQDSFNFTGFASATAAQQPLYTTNNLSMMPVVMFNGTSQRLTLNNHVDINSGGPYGGKTIFAVIETGSSNTRRQLIYEEGDQTAGLSIFLLDDKLWASVWNLSTDKTTPAWGQQSVSSPVAPYRRYLLRMNMDGTGGVLSLNIDGLRVDQKAGIGKLPPHTGAIGIGAINTSTRSETGTTLSTGAFFGGGISELLYHKKSLSDNESALIEQDLRQRWKLTDDSTDIANGIILWLKPEQLAGAAATRVGLWNDDGPYNLDAIQSTNNKNPLISFSAGRTLRQASFDGANDELRIASNSWVDSALSYQEKVIALSIATLVDVTKTQALVNEGDLNTGLNIYITAGRLYFNIYNASPTWGPVSLSTPVLANKTYNVIVEYSLSVNKVRLYVNGTMVGESSAPLGALGKHSSSLGLGCAAATTKRHDGATLSGCFAGSVAEVLYYGQVMPALQRGKLQSYLNARFPN